MVNIYRLIDPLTLEVKYVGKTIESLNRRLYKHLTPQSLNCKRHSSYWLKSLKTKNLKPIIELIEITEMSNWQDREIYWIKYYKDLGCKLVNSTIGGDRGNLGYKHTEEAKQAISVKNKRPKSSSWIKNAADSMRKITAKPILQYTKDGVFVKEWESFCYAAKYLDEFNYKAKIKNIHACCNNKRSSAYEYKWIYKNVEIKDKEPL